MPRRRRASRPLDIRDTHVVKDGDVFMLCDRFGDVPRGNDAALGMYFRDTRFLSRLEIWIDRTRPVFLHSESDRGYAMAVQATLPVEALDPSGRALAKNLSLLRRRRIENGVRESLEVHNHGIARRRIRIDIAFEADFLDVFEVRGFTASRRNLLPPEVGESSVTLRYEGADAIERSVELAFAPAPTKVGAGGTRFDVVVEPQSSATVTIAITPRVAGEAPGGGTAEETAADYDEWLASCTAFTTSNEIVQRHLDRSVLDLRTLRSGSHAGIPDAGVPWFSTLFGRDALLAAYQALSLNPGMARAALETLAAFQGVEEVVWTEEEPGKIPHELRRGELAGSGQIPHTPYYGSVDATPLWLVLYGHWWRWTADVEAAERLWPHAQRALDWMDRYGDLDGDGYVEYVRRSPAGLDNQGWKDSHDAVVHRDGRLAEGTVALVEVQGYVYDARRRAAEVARALGRPDVATDLETRAAETKKRFNEDYWMPDAGYYALALDGDKRQVGSITSNPGHCLWSGIVDDPERVDATVRMLLSERLSTGWGIRTLSGKNPGYDPVGYHTGTVWPHDVALIAHGMRWAGRPDAAATVIDALAAAATHMRGGRFPELYCGYSSEEVAVPVEYPVACRPHAVAAGAMLLAVSTLLGLRPDAANERLEIVDPALPAWLERLDLTGLRVGDNAVDLAFRRQDDITACRALARSGDLEVVVRH